MLQIPQSLCTDLTDEQASTVQGGLNVEITGIQAIKADADTGWWWKDDDTFLTIDGKKVFGPKSFKSGTFRKVSIKRDVGSSGRIEAFDEDKVFTGNDYLGGFTVSSPTKDGRARISGSGSVYDIYYNATA